MRHNRFNKSTITWIFYCANVLRNEQRKSFTVCMFANAKFMTLSFDLHFIQKKNPSTKRQNIVEMCCKYQSQCKVKMNWWWQQLKQQQQKKGNWNRFERHAKVFSWCRERTKSNIDAENEREKIRLLIKIEQLKGTKENAISISFVHWARINFFCNSTSALLRTNIKREALENGMHCY